MLQYKNHIFSPYGAEECLCRKCGFVTWNDPTPEDVEQLFEDAGITEVECPNAWHKFKYKDFDQ